MSRKGKEERENQGEKEEDKWHIRRRELT